MRDEVLVELVKQAKASQFGLTGIKIEFEARFGRRILMEDHCSDCCGQGRIVCYACDGLPTTIACNNCNNTRLIGCSNCDGEPTLGPEAMNWDDMRAIHDLVLGRLAKLGLAEKIPKKDQYQFAHKWRPVHPIVFSKVYPDGTVDTEQTLTISVDKPENVFLLPKIAEAFYELRKDIGLPVDVSTAGMHITLLNSPHALYPMTDTTPADRVRFDNFQKSMILLMPALFFMGSSNDNSRTLEYRRPRVSRTDKYSAVAYRGGGLEFRVFETCYDTPEVILDDVAVALNCLKFWTKRYTRNHLAKVANNVRFGKNQGDKLARMYVTNEHIDLLNRGIRMIKPSYLSVTELKKQRNFTISKNDTKNAESRARVEAEAEYKKYETKYGWENVMRKNNYINIYIESHVLRGPIVASEDIVKQEAEQFAESEVAKYETDHKLSVEKFCATKIPEILSAGEYELCVV